MRHKKRNPFRHPLVESLLSLTGNPKICTFIEPLWGVPYHLIAPFVTLYMYAMGVDDLQIGILLSVAMVFQVVCSFAGGILADKLGRKTTTMLGDFFGWSMATLVWAVSQNFWFFLLAMGLNAFEQINQTAWVCLLIEDAKEKDIVNIWNWIFIAGTLTVFFAPISGWLIGEFTLVPVMRGLYSMFSICMMIKCYITWKYMRETERGQIRKAETTDVPVWKMIAEYRHLIPQIFKAKSTMQTLGIMVIMTIAIMVNNNFFGLYVHNNLGVSEGTLALFPILRAAVMLIFMFAVQNKVQRLGIKKPMLIGFLLYIVCQALLIFSPQGQLATLIVFVLLEATAYGLVMPRKESMMALNVEPRERARIMALMFALQLSFSAPFGSLVGWMSSIDRRLPFVFSVALFILAISIMLFFQERKLSDGTLGEVSNT